MHNLLQVQPLIEVTKAKILLVDDEKINTMVLADALKDFELVYQVQSGAEAIKFCKKTPPDLVILDVKMPNMNGHITCKMLKNLPHMQNCPIIFSTSLSSVEDELACWDAGGADFVSKPVTPRTLLKRIWSHIELKLRHDIHQELAFFDGLTGLKNRRFFDDFYQQQIALAKRIDEDLSVIIIDIDFFKQYNDKYGHAQGDTCLRFVAQTIEKQLHRPTDTAARYGGEEFVVVLPNTDLPGAQFVANKIIKQIENEGLVHMGSTFKIVTASAGVASLKTNGDNTDVFLVADKHLYQAKSTGRNVCV